MNRTALSLALVVVCLGARLVSAQTNKPSEQVVYANEQSGLTPGCAVGTPGIADPAIADYRVLPGRREILLLGKEEGRTTLTIWDQQGAKRDDGLARVRRRRAG